MKKALLYILLVLIVAVAGMMGYQYFNQPELGPLPDIPPPPAETSSLEQAPAGACSNDEVSAGGGGMSGNGPSSGWLKYWYPIMPATATMRTSRM